MKTQSTTTESASRPRRAPGQARSRRPHHPARRHAGRRQRRHSTVAVTCYRDRCRTLNVLSSRKPTPPTPRTRSRA